MGRNKGVDATCVRSLNRCFCVGVFRHRLGSVAKRSILHKFGVLGWIIFPAHDNIKDMCFLQNYVRTAKQKKAVFQRYCC